jgi:hypothetical protein
MYAPSIRLVTYTRGCGEGSPQAGSRDPPSCLQVILRGMLGVLVPRGSEGSDTAFFK